MNAARSLWRGAFWAQGGQQRGAGCADGGFDCEGVKGARAGAGTTNPEGRSKPPGGGVPEADPRYTGAVVPTRGTRTDYCTVCTLATGTAGRAGSRPVRRVVGVEPSTV